MWKDAKLVHDGDTTKDADLLELNETDESAEEAYFSKSVLYILLDNVIDGISVRFRGATDISENFSFLWRLQILPEGELEPKSKSLADKYLADTYLQILICRG